MIEVQTIKTIRATCNKCQCVFTFSSYDLKPKPPKSIFDRLLNSPPTTVGLNCPVCEAWLTINIPKETK